MSVQLLSRIRRYRKRPVEILAVRWDGTDEAFSEICRLGGRQQVVTRLGDNLIIPTPEGDHVASLGDWIIRGIAGEIYPCKPDIFEVTYEPIVGGA